MYRYKLGGQITETDVIRFSDTIENGTSPEYIILDCDKLKEMQEGLKRLFNALKSTNTIRELSLGKTNNHVFGVRHMMSQLSDVLAVNSSIQTLILDGDVFGPYCGIADMERFSNALEVNTSIGGLILWNNEIGRRPGFLERIADALSKNKRIHSLVISDNKLNETPSGLKYFSKFLEGNTTIRVLSLSYNGLGQCPEGMEYLSLALKTNNTIEDLDLGCNQFGQYPESTKFLSDALEFNSTIKTLRLPNNRLGVFMFRDTGPICLGYLLEALKINKSIRMLDLYRNFIGTSPDPLWTRHISNILGVNDVIQPDLFWMKFISDVLKANVAIQNIHLEWDMFVDYPEGCSLIVDALTHNTSITEVGLFDKCFCAQKPLKVIDDIADRNKHNNNLKESSLFEMMLPMLNECAHEG